MNSEAEKIIFPTAYLPPIEYFAYIIRAKEIYIELHETYPKQTYRNRCKIYTANGLLSLSIPVTKANGRLNKITDITINNQEAWQNNHWRAIKSAYNASPYFLYFQDELSYFYTNTFNSLHEFNTQLLTRLFSFIGIKKEIHFTRTYEKNIENMLDLREYFNPKKENESFVCPKYFQVFDERFGFLANLSIIDLLFSEGSNTLSFLEEINFTI